MMSQFQVSADDSQVQAMLARAARRLNNMRPLYDDIGAYMERDTDQRFQRQQAPDGTPWRDLSPNTWASKRNRKILNETGQMRDSLAYEATGTEVIIGFADKKARWHQFGTRPYTIAPNNARMLAFMTAGGPAFARQVNHPGIPARPMLGISRANVEEIGNIVGDHIGKP
jgi:phage virion morphogenesis protein